jgi:hypothetical protein
MHSYLKYQQICPSLHLVTQVAPRLAYFDESCILVYDVHLVSHSICDDDLVARLRHVTYTLNGSGSLRASPARTKHQKRSLRDYAFPLLPLQGTEPLLLTLQELVLRKRQTKKEPCWVLGLLPAVAAQGLLAAWFSFPCS